jgi:hypothetical protein
VRFKFPNDEVAIGVDLGLSAPDELDVVALRDGDELLILGLDDHPILGPEIIRICELAGGVRLPDDPSDL